MDDYIKRSDAIKTVCGDCEYYSTNDCEDCRLDRLTKIPAADVRPVVRGKWIEHDFGGGNISYECSECHEVSCCNGNYCTDCGADMRDSNLDTTKGDNHD